MSYLGHSEYGYAGYSPGGSLYINALPSNAEVRLDGVLVGVANDLQATPVEARPGVHRLTFQLLRSHVANGADEQAGLRGERSRVCCRGANTYPGSQRPEQFGEAEIKDLDLAAGRHEEIRGFDIAMDDALRVRGIERVGNLCADVQKPDRIEGLSANVILERLAFEQLHDDKEHTLVLIDRVDRADMGVVQG